MYQRPSLLRREIALGQNGRSYNTKTNKSNLPPAAFSVEVTIVEVELVRYPHDALGEVLLVDDEVAAVLAALHPHEVLGLVIVVEVGQQPRHGHPLLARQVHAVHQPVLTRLLVITDRLANVLLLRLVKLQ